MDPLDKLDLDTFLAEGTELDRDTLRQYLSQGQSAYQSVTALTTKNQQIINEKKQAADKLATYEQTLTTKGLTLDDIANWNPNPDKDETLKKFQQQLEDTRKQFELDKDGWKTKYDTVVAERDELNSTITNGKIQQEFAKIAATAGVDPGSIEDLYLVAKGRGIELFVNEAGAVRGKRPNDVIDSDLGTLLTTLKSDPTYQKYYTGKFVTGSGTNADKATGGITNPWEQGKENLTEQTRIYRESPELANQLKKMAGVK